jgi:hypothetical protein
MQTTAPTQSAMGPYSFPVQPSATNTRHVTIRVAIVIPEIGLDDVPMRPVMRDDTVTKRNPKTMTRIAARKLPCIGIFGARARKIARSSDPTSTKIIGRSRSVRTTAPLPAPAPKPFRPSRAEPRIVGSVRPSVMSPAASTAPAPM